jgi:hypothetical protein
MNGWNGGISLKLFSGTSDCFGVDGDPSFIVRGSAAVGGNRSFADRSNLPALAPGTGILLSPMDISRDVSRQAACWRRHRPEPLHVSLGISNHFE